MVIDKLSLIIISIFYPACRRRHRMYHRIRIQNSITISHFEKGFARITYGRDTSVSGRGVCTYMYEQGWMRLLLELYTYLYNTEYVPEYIRLSTHICRVHTSLSAMELSGNTINWMGEFYPEMINSVVWGYSTQVCSN